MLYKHMAVTNTPISHSYLSCFMNDPSFGPPKPHLAGVSMTVAGLAHQDNLSKARQAASAPAAKCH